MAFAIGSFASFIPPSLPRAPHRSSRSHPSRSSQGAKGAAFAAIVAAAARQGLRTTRRAERAETASKVVLMGDSVLDNFFWLETPKRHLRVQLQDALAKSRDRQVKQLKCVNLAVDQMTTFDFAERKPEANPWDVYAAARKKVAFEEDEDKQYVVDSDGSIRSVENLRKLSDVKWVVLSLGGNDVYLNAEVKAKLVSSLLPSSEGKRKEVAKEFAKRLQAAIDQVKEAAPEAALILVVPYQPHQDFSLLMGAPINDEGKRIYGDILGDGTRVLERNVLPDLVNPMVLEMLNLGREYGCPIVDLSQTLDPGCEEHYGTGEIGKVNELGTAWSGAEPSDVSNNFTAQLLAHAITQGPKASVYRGLPRQEERGWTMVVKEETNDWIFEKDYRFGGKPVSTISRKKEGGGKPLFQLGAGQSFLLGAGLVILVNLFLLLQGGNPLGFDREEFERQLEAQGLKDPAKTTAASSSNS